MGETKKGRRWRLRWGDYYLKSYWISRRTPSRGLTWDSASDPMDAMPFSSRSTAEECAKKVNFYLDHNHQFVPIEVDVTQVAQTR